MVKFGKRGDKAVEVYEAMKKAVDGELTGWEGISEGTDWARVDKVSATIMWFEGQIDEMVLDIQTQ